MPPSQLSVSEERRTNRPQRRHRGPAAYLRVVGVVNPAGPLASCHVLSHRPVPGGQADVS